MEVTPKMALNLRFESPEEDSGAETLRGYLRALLLTLFKEDEGFSGKRPFGNSGWQHGLAAKLIGAGLPIGRVDHDGYIESLDDIAYNKVITDAINSL